MAKHTVRQGDCIESIAYENGHFWETIWNNVENSALKQKRKEPNVLLPGDVVFVPEIRLKEESGQTEQSHRFKRKGVPSILRMVLLGEDGEPRANERYILEIDGELTSGTTQADGSLKQRIKPNATKGKLLVGEKQDEYFLDLGYIDPITEISGAQARLNNLGFNCGEVTGAVNPETREAIQRFQREYSLQESGVLDKQTRNKLNEVYRF